MTRNNKWQIHDHGCDKLKAWPLKNRNKPFNISLPSFLFNTNYVNTGEKKLFIKQYNSVFSISDKWSLIHGSHLLFVVDCQDPTCSNNGICVNGECHCKPGWGGPSCGLPRAQCPDQCHGHGAFIPDTGICSCDPNWMGPDCSVGQSECFIGFQLYKCFISLYLISNVWYVNSSFTALSFSPHRGLLSWLRDTWRMHGWLVPLRRGLDGCGVRPARV